MTSFRQPGYLTRRDEPTLRIRCPVHGFIRFSDNERRIIEHPLFQRLRHVRQLALTDLLYPGATHTRFEHSLGVMEVATRAFDTLAAKNGAVLEGALKKVAGFEKRPLPKARQLLRLAALLHDIGHAPFSHAVEDSSGLGLSHEELGAHVIHQPALLGSLIDGLFWKGCSDLAARVLCGGAELPPQLTILASIISGQIDADRTDYLVRDSHHCGVEYGRFDYRRMIECLELCERKGGVLELALNHDGLHCFEALILARYQMSTQVYYHRVRRIYDLYLKRYCQECGPDLMGTPEKILALDDVGLMSRIREDAAKARDKRSRWAKRIAERHHHREVLSTGFAADARAIKRAKAAYDRLGKEYPAHEFLFDDARGNIHKLFRPGDQDDRGLEEFRLVGRRAAPGPLIEASQILKEIPREFRCGRIYADVEAADLGLRETIRRKADQYRREAANP